MASTAASTPEPAPAPASRPYQPVFMESMTLPRDQRKGWSPLDNPKYMGSKEKLKIFFTEQPLIPIGLTATIGFFVYGMGHFVSGKTPASNWKFQAGRVGCQALTVAAMGYYGWFGPMKKRKYLKQRIP